MFECLRVRKYLTSRYVKTSKYLRVDSFKSSHKFFADKFLWNLPIGRVRMFHRYGIFFGWFSFGRGTSEKIFHFGKIALLSRTYERDLAPSRQQDFAWRLGSSKRFSGCQSYEGCTK